MSCLNKIILIVILFAIFIRPNVLVLAEEENKIELSSNGPFCGLQCIYASMKLFGKQVEFKDLMKTKYVGSYNGSSLKELQKAVKDKNLYAEPVEKMTCFDLKKCDDYIILHVKSSPTSQEYDHYELLLGKRNSLAILFNPPNQIRHIPFAELAPCWDGTGLIVSNKRINLSSIFASARKRLIIYSFMVIFAVFSLHWAKRFLPMIIFNTQFKLTVLSIVQALGFIITAVFMGVGYHFINEAGFLARVNATSLIQEAHQGNFIPKITEKKVEQLLDTDTIFIDARFSFDYEVGHIEGAINIPVNSTDEERSDLTKEISKNDRIVMYCQSSGCKYAEIVAIKLQKDGFRNISIYKGGWMDWKEKNIKEEKSS